MLIGTLLPDKLEEYENVPYLGYGTLNLRIKGQSIKSGNFLSRSSGAVVDDCSVYGQYFGEGSIDLTLSHSRIIGSDALYRSKNPKCFHSIIMRNNTAIYSRNANFDECTFGGDHVLSHSSDLKVTNSIFTQHAFCGSKNILVHALYIHGVSNPKSGIIAAHTIDEISFDKQFADPSKTIIFAVSGTSKKVIRVKPQDLEGTWTLSNLEDRLLALCEKYKVEPTVKLKG
jgi:hypothetical protein